LSEPTLALIGDKVIVKGAVGLLLTPNIPGTEDANVIAPEQLFILETDDILYTTTE
jgi:hypothetical protein